MAGGVRPARRTIILAVLTFAASSAHALTLEEARDLPLGELARRMLGAAGATVVDVRRPDWARCRGPITCGPPPLGPDGRAPMPSGWHSANFFDATMTFYHKPSALVDSLNLWAGLCRTTTVTLDFDDAGNVKALSAADLYGVDGRMRRIPDPFAEPGSPDEKDARFRAIEQAETDKCQKTAVRSYFAADGMASAQTGVEGAALLAEALRGAGRMPFAFSCVLLDRRCNASDYRMVAGAIDPKSIQQIGRWECAKVFPDARPTLDMCLSIMLADDGERLLLQVATPLRIVRADYSMSHVVY